MSITADVLSHDSVRKTEVYHLMVALEGQVENTVEIENINFILSHNDIQMNQDREKDIEEERGLLSNLYLDMDHESLYTLKDEQSLRHGDIENNMSPLNDMKIVMKTRQIWMTLLCQEKAQLLMYLNVSHSLLAIASESRICIYDHHTHCSTKMNDGNSIDKDGDDSSSNKGQHLLLFSPPTPDALSPATQGIAVRCLPYRDQDGSSFLPKVTTMQFLPLESASSGGYLLVGCTLGDLFSIPWAIEGSNGNVRDGIGVEHVSCVGESLSAIFITRRVDMKHAKDANSSSSASSQKNDHYYITVTTASQYSQSIFPTFNSHTFVAISQASSATPGSGTRASMVYTPMNDMAVELAFSAEGMTELGGGGGATMMEQWRALHASTMKGSAHVVPGKVRERGDECSVEPSRWYSYRPGNACLGVVGGGALLGYETMLYSILDFNVVMIGCPNESGDIGIFSIDMNDQGVDHLSGNERMIKENVLSSPLLYTLPPLTHTHREGDPGVTPPGVDLTTLSQSQLNALYPTLERQYHSLLIACSYRAEQVTQCHKEVQKVASLLALLEKRLQRGNTTAHSQSSYMPNSATSSPSGVHRDHTNQDSIMNPWNISPVEHKDNQSTSLPRWTDNVHIHVDYGTDDSNGGGGGGGGVMMSISIATHDKLTARVLHERVCSFAVFHSNSGMDSSDNQIFSHSVTLLLQPTTINTCCNAYYLNTERAESDLRGGSTIYECIIHYPLILTRAVMYTMELHLEVDFLSPEIRNLKRIPGTMGRNSSHSTLEGPNHMGQEYYYTSPTAPGLECHPGSASGHVLFLGRVQIPLMVVLKNTTVPLVQKGDNNDAQSAGDSHHRHHHRREAADRNDKEQQIREEEEALSSQYTSHLSIAPQEPVDTSLPHHPDRHFSSLTHYKALLLSSTQALLHHYNEVFLETERRSTFGDGDEDDGRLKQDIYLKALQRYSMMKTCVYNAYRGSDRGGSPGSAPLMSESDHLDLTAFLGVDPLYNPSDDDSDGNGGNPFQKMFLGRYMMLPYYRDRVYLDNVPRSDTMRDWVAQQYFHTYQSSIDAGAGRDPIHNVHNNNTNTSKNMEDEYVDRVEAFSPSSLALLHASIMIDQLKHHEASTSNTSNENGNDNTYNTTSPHNSRDAYSFNDSDVYCLPLGLQQILLDVSLIIKQLSEEEDEEEEGGGGGGGGHSQDGKDVMDAKVDDMDLEHASYDLHVENANPGDHHKQEIRCFMQTLQRMSGNLDLEESGSDISRDPGGIVLMDGLCERLWKAYHALRAAY